MKKVLFLFLCLFVCFVGEGQIVIKPKIGLTLSRVKTPAPDFFYYQPDNQILKIGFQAGSGVEYNINSMFTLEADLLYTRKGLRDTTHIPGFGRYSYYKGYSYNFHYIELPVLIHFKVDNHLKLGVGPSVSYLVKAQYFLGREKKNNSSIDYSNFDFGLVADASWTVQRFEVGARFTYGLSKVDFVSKYFDPEFPSQSAGTLGKNRTFQFYINYLIKK
jgi:hypothetical protein